MDVERSLWGEVEHRGRQEQAVSRDDDCIGASRMETRQRIGGFQSLGLKEFQPAGHSKTLHRARHRSQTSPRWAVRLRDDELYLVAFIEEPRKRSLGEFRCARED
jgi:hypothetical protein